MDWFKAHHGISNNNTLRVVGFVSKQPLAYVNAMWLSLLDYASQHNPRGFLTDVDIDGVGVSLGIDPDIAQSIYLAMRDRRLIDDDMRIVEWDAYQKNDTSAERMRRYRQKKKELDAQDEDNTSSNYDDYVKDSAKDTHEIGKNLLKNKDINNNSRNAPLRNVTSQIRNGDGELRNVTSFSTDTDTDTDIDSLLTLKTETDTPREADVDDFVDNYVDNLGDDNFNKNDLTCPVLSSVPDGERTEYEKYLTEEIYAASAQLCAQLKIPAGQVFDTLVEHWLRSWRRKGYDRINKPAGAFNNWYLNVKIGMINDKKH